MKRLFKQIWKFLLSFGPGLFCIGYTMGTGSVTSMVKAGSDYGSSLLDMNPESFLSNFRGSCQRAGFIMSIIMLNYYELLSSRSSNSKEDRLPEDKR